MSTTTENQCTSAHVKGDIFLNGRCVHFADDYAAGPATTLGMPSADEYAQGMKKLRARANCPVLSPEETLLAEELSDIDLDMPNAPQPESTPGKRMLWTDEYHQGKATKRPTVAEYLADQRRKDMIDRMPDFERFTHNELRGLKKEVRSLTFKLLMTNWIVAAVIIIAILMKLA
ncbi:hypothetical protein ACTXGO_00960 [Psychrobacter sp. T6-1]|uniref:hypothetical protein n=1 Tax=Psychrobacter sp. T6-1 TaxID=3457447 RepID=UPI003FD03F72